MELQGLLRPDQVGSYEATHQFPPPGPDIILQGKVTLGRLEIRLSDRLLLIDLEVFNFERELMNVQPTRAASQACPDRYLGRFLISNKQGFTSIDAGLDCRAVTESTSPDQSDGSLAACRALSRNHSELLVKLLLLPFSCIHSSLLS
jgi:hypothetical protein